MKLSYLLLLLLTLVPAIAQNPQTQTAPIYSVNAKYVNGVAPGYAPTIDAGGGPFLDLGPGTSFCGTSLHIYPSGIYQLTVNTTNYIYLDTTASCIPTVSTSTFTSTQIPIAIVTVSAIGNITGIVDARTEFNSNTVSGSFCSLGGCTLTGLLTVPSLVINSSGTITGIQGTDSNLMSSGTISGSTGTAVCLDSNNGLTTSGCTGGSGGNATSIQSVAVSSTFPTNGFALVYNSGPGQWVPTNLATTYCPIAGCPFSGNITVPSIVINSSPTMTNVQGSDTKFMSAGTITGIAGTAVCLDGASGLTTSGCTPSGNATSIQGIAVNAATPTTSQAIVYNGSQYIPTTLPVSTSIGLPASCTAGALWTNPSPTGTNNVVYECYSTNNWITLSPSLSGTPSIGADSGAGTGPTVTLTAGASDQAGWINVTTGTGPAASAGVVTVTFGNTSYPAQPVCNVYPASAATAALSGTGQVYVSQSSSSSTLFVASVGSSALAATTAYKWGYSCLLP